MIRAKKAMLFNVIPSLGRQIHQLADLPIADHGAELFGRAIDEGLFLFAQLRFWIGQQLAPVRTATEQLAVPPDRASFNGFTLGLRHRRQVFLKPAEYWRREEFSAQIRQQQESGHGCEHHPEKSA
ncbi:hypothetical protein ACFS4T_26215 [Pseudomonas lini]